MKRATWLVVTFASAALLLAVAEPHGAVTAGRPPANEGLPLRWFAVVEWSYADAVSSMESQAKATFVLHHVERRGSGSRTLNTYYYRPTGTLRARYSHEDGGCSWKAQGTVPIRPEHEALFIGVTKEPGKRPYVEYGSGFPPGVRTPKVPTIPETITCETTMSSVRHVHWLRINATRTRTSAATLQRTTDYPGGGRPTGYRRWCFTRREADLANCRAQELNAVARVSGSKLRAATRTLDGSKSTGDIESYKWTFASSRSCNGVEPKAGATKRGARVTIKPLCTIGATLTVSDGRDEDSDTVEVTVTPRIQGWRTTVLHRWIATPAQGAPSGAPIGAPVASCTPTNDCTIELKGGLNVPDPRACPGEEFRGSRVFCPLRGTRRTWNGRGYTLARVSDPGGPFDGYSYVKSATFTVRRLAYVNPDLLPGSAFYNQNKAAGAPIDGFVAAVKAHEGWGAEGKPETGHSQIMRALIADPKAGHDPRRELERLIALSAGELQDEADDKVAEIDELVDTRSDDPLAPLWEGTLYFYDPGNRKWVFGLFRVPHPSR
jgi:hypothetical protein